MKKVLLLTVTILLFACGTTSNGTGQEEDHRESSTIIDKVVRENENKLACDSNLFSYSESSQGKLSLEGFNLDYIKEKKEGVIPVDICIPSEHEGYKIVEIGKNAFEDKGLLSIDFSEAKNLEVIDFRAFYNNEIKDLNFFGARNLKGINGMVFSKNQIETVNFSDLTELKYISSLAFSANNVEHLIFHRNDSLEEIGDFAFSGNRLDSLYLDGAPNLVSIGDGAFDHNYLTYVDLRSNLKLEEIGEEAFNYNGVEKELSNDRRLGDISVHRPEDLGQEWVIYEDDNTWISIERLDNLPK